jgi:hypothetical protein
MLLAFSYLQSIEIASFFDQVITKEYRLINYYNAYSCIDQAMSRLSSDYFFRINNPVKIGYLSCKIIKIYDSNGFVVIESQGDYKGVNVNRTAKVKLYDNRLELVQ